MDNDNQNISKYQKIEETEIITETEEVPEESKEKKKGRRRKNKKDKKHKDAQAPVTAEEITEDSRSTASGEEIYEDYHFEDMQPDNFDGMDISDYLTDDAADESLDDILKSVAIMENGGDEAEIRDIYADLQEPSDPDADITEQEKDIPAVQEEETEDVNEEYSVDCGGIQPIITPEISGEDPEEIAESAEESGTEEDASEAIKAEEDTPAEETDSYAEETAEAAEPIKKKAKKEKKIKEKKPKEKKVKEKKEKEPLAKKDYITIAIAIIALLAIAVLAVYYFKGDTNDNNRRQETTTEADKLADVQIVRSGTIVDLIQSDIPDVFYGVTSDYKVKYFQYYEGEVHAALATNNISLKVDLGSATVPVRINYVELGGRTFGFGLFTAEEDSDVYFYDMVAFKITDLPEKYRKEGHALLLATTSKKALTSNAINWSESFDVNLETGETTRFLKIINRRMDNETGTYETNFCLLSNAGYTSASDKIPFFSAREYPLGVEDMQDIFVKTGSNEKLLASDVYGRFCLMDGNTVIYMRKTTTGFNVIYNKDGNEEVGDSFYGLMNSSYINYKEYILSKSDGKLYNLLTRESKTLIGYSMSNPDYFCVSDDGKYLIVIGTVKNALDYQVQMFNLETGEYAKMEDKNYSPHSNLCVIDEKTAAYCVVDPNQGFECVVLDLEKAFD